MKNHAQPSRLALVNYYSGMQKEVYQAVNLLEREYNVISLYSQTPFQNFVEYSPLLIELSPSDPIIEHLPQQQLLLFGADAAISTEQMIAILRHRLIVLFNNGQKGLCHYFVPEMASYLFYYSPVSETAAWLGGMNQVSFYCQVLSEQKQWLDIVIENPLPLNPPALDANHYWQITPSQQRALTLHVIDKSTAQWAAANKLTQWDWQQQATLASWCANQNISDKRLINRIRTCLHYYQLEPWRKINTEDPIWQTASEQTKAQQIEQLQEVAHV